MKHKLQLSERILLVLSLVLFLVMVGNGCTIVPKPVKDNVASFDGNEQNSGVLYWDGDGSLVITGKARERYNALIAVYGERFQPALVPDAGLQAVAAAGSADEVGPNGVVYKLDKEHVVKFGVMNQWRKAGQ